MDRTLGAVLAAALVLAAPQSQAQPPGPGTLKASNAFMGCLVRKAQKQDDGHSPAAAVAKSIQGSCRNEQQSWEQAHTANYTAEKRRDFLAGMRAKIDAIALQTVTETRKLKF